MQCSALHCTALFNSIAKTISDYFTLHYVTQHDLTLHCVCVTSRYVTSRRVQSGERQGTLENYRQNMFQLETFARPKDRISSYRGQVSCCVSCFRCCGTTNLELTTAGHNMYRICARVPQKIKYVFGLAQLNTGRSTSTSAPTIRYNVLMACCKYSLLTSRHVKSGHVMSRQFTSRHFRRITSHHFA